MEKIKKKGEREMNERVGEEEKIKKGRMKRKRRRKEKGK